MSAISTALHYQARQACQVRAELTTPVRSVIRYLATWLHQGLFLYVQQATPLLQAAPPAGHGRLKRRIQGKRRDRQISPRIRDFIHAFAE